MPDFEVPKIYPRSKEYPPLKYDITQTFDWEADKLTTTIATQMRDASDRVVHQHYQTDFTELREFLDAKRAGFKLVAVKPGHGDLIDRAELLKKVRCKTLDDLGDYLLWYVTEEDITSTPTVIPAEEDE